MTLSVCLITKDSAAYVEPLLAGARAYADELVVAVDASSTDATLDLCRKYADKLFRIPPIGFLERGLEWLNEQCSGDWILRLDDDELPSEGLVRALPALMADRTYTHYWLPRRWLVRCDPHEWIAQGPWWPDWQLRLFRNLPSLITVPGRLHTSYVVQGAGRYLSEGSLYHKDLFLRSDEELRAKVERYDRLSGGKGQAFLYLIPDRQALRTEAPPDDDGLPDPAPWPRWPDAERYRWSDILEVAADEIARPMIEPPARVQTPEPECPLCGAEFERPDLFRASIILESAPTQARPGELFEMTLKVRNESPVAWAPLPHACPEVRIGYHWYRLREIPEVHDWEGLRTQLPAFVGPGQWAEASCTAMAPIEPGTYTIEFDLVIEGVAWFSRYGFTGPQAVINVIQRPHPAGLDEALERGVAQKTLLA